MKGKFGRILPIIFGILLISLWAHPQIRESGEIQGNVTDTEGAPLPGATVTVESPNLIGGAQSRMTDANGFYRFRSLSIGLYKVTASLSGFNTMVKEGIRLHAGITLGCDFKMTQATVEEEVIVVAEIPTVDIKSSQPKSLVLTDDLLLSIPVAGFASLMHLSPGDDYYSPYGAGYNTTSSWQFDGIDVRQPHSGSTGFSVDFNVIKEAAVMGLGLPAEYGHFTGAVLTAVSKSGSNRFSTLNQFRYRGKAWNSQNWKQVPEDEWYPYYKPASDYKYEVLPYYDFGLQFGGKLIHDRLWFFASGEYDYSKQEIIARDTPQKTENRKVFGKLTYQLNASNKMNLSFNHTYYKSSGGGSIYYPQGMWYERKTPQYFGNLNWTSILSDKTFLDVKLGIFRYQYHYHPSTGDLDTPSIYDTGERMYYDNLPSYSESNSWNYDVNVQFNHYVPELIKGSHDFKFGSELKHYVIITKTGKTGNANISYVWGVPYSKDYKDPTDSDNYATEFTGFMQDTWSLTKRLTLNLGLRYDHFWYRVPPPGQGTFYKNGVFSPRAGVTYDILGDRKNIVKIHYAHYVEKLDRNDFYARFDPRRNAGVIKYRWDASINDWKEMARTEAADFPAVIDPDVKHPWIREISGGFERELFRDASLAINFYSRTRGAAWYYFNSVYQYVPTTTIHPGNDGRVGTADDQGVIDCWDLLNRYDFAFEVTNPKKGNPPYLTEDHKWYARGIEVIFTKRFSNRWAMNVSYHYTVCKGNTSGAMVSLFDPNYQINAYGEQGGSFYSQPHQFKAQGNVLIPFVDINLGFTARAMSGRQAYRSFTAYLPGYRVAIKGEPPGTTKYDARYDLDIRIQKIFRVQGWTLVVFGDIYNALNNHDGNNGIYLNYGTLNGYRTSIKNPRQFQIGFRVIY
ncbi:MAG: TonB-dependent receptor [Candidatus Aminicenantes bacterium]|nr:MAG: TonB-dependent receptor [Candidatus Aminicenantes bacterium]